jgi:hypothetical protein
MLKSSFFVAPFLALMQTTSLVTQASARETVGSNQSAVGREVAAPPWSAAAMTDHGPSECGEPMWIYSSPGSSLALPERLLMRAETH